MLNILREIIPDKNEKKIVLDISKNFIRKLNSKFKEGKCVLGGSIAKDTWIKGDSDIDVFAVFNKKYSKENISKILEKRLKEMKFKIKKIHGSRDYFQVRQGDYNLEVVPILNVKNAKEAKNITDVSPLHVKWVRKHKRLLNEIRLVKAFCKANKLYGAESYIKGFSGYVLEILTIYYGSFEKLISNSKKWKEELVIDIEKHYDGLNESKKSPLIVIDPVQNNRNAAAALSLEKFNKFIEIAKEFKRNPSEKFFVLNKINDEDLRGALILEAKALKGKKDIIGSKLLKALDFIAKRLKEEGYEIEDYDWEWSEKIKFWYFVKENELSEKYRHYGPPIKEEKHLEEFRRKYKKYKLLRDDGRVYIELKRKHKDVFSFVKSLLKDEYLKDKVREIKLII